jgi:hypothetical protein
MQKPLLKCEEKTLTNYLTFILKKAIFTVKIRFRL